MNNNASEKLIFGIFVLPSLAFVLFATDIPFLLNLYYSVFDWNGISKSMSFIGMGNFVKTFTDDALFWQSVSFTLRFTLFYVVLVNITSLMAALALQKGSTVSILGRAFFYIPYIISLTAIGLIWKFLLGPGFDALYQLSGNEFFGISWLGEPKYAFIIVVVMSVWQTLGFYMINYITGLIAVPTDLLEAATIDGANAIQRFFHVTLPMIMPAISICLLTSLTFAFKLFDIILVFTKGGPANSTVTVTYDIYKEAFINSNYGLATAKSLIFVAFVLIVTLFQTKLTKKQEVEI
ncbi:carbohydrate ABC transporter permease [Sediminispirochaeta bajacaliforniensis]|uniref:carbohydrate ABC transporter permease n=1 Tax=Sediminispirochaeta bajacaliforniensis TaxID=148 RepID=UPI00035C76C5|nr:sugar ABC transporter permease [Sediminispirochaeta bajacaliforniensis]